MVPSFYHFHFSLSSQFPISCAALSLSYLKSIAQHNRFGFQSFKFQLHNTNRFDYNTNMFDFRLLILISYIHPLDFRFRFHPLDFRFRLHPYRFRFHPLKFILSILLLINYSLLFMDFCLTITAYWFQDFNFDFSLSILVAQQVSIFDLGLSGFDFRLWFQLWSFDFRFQTRFHFQSQVSISALKFRFQVSNSISFSIPCFDFTY